MLAPTVAATLLVLVAPAQAPSPKAVSVGAGPLLCFQTYDLSSGKHETVHWIAELDGSGPAREFWRSGTNASVLRRLDRDHLLVGSYGEPYAMLLFDLPAGTARELAPGAPHGLVAVHGDDVLHLGDPRPAANDSFLYARSWRSENERRRLADVRFAEVPLVQGNLAVAIADEEREIWIVSLTRATGRRVWQIPEGARWPRVALSPAGQRLAIGCVDANGRGLLTVVDASSGARVREWNDLPIQVSPFSSDAPKLEAAFADDTHVVVSETRGDANGLAGQFVHVTRDLGSGEVTDETAYGPIGLSHQPFAPKTTAAPKPAFVIATAGDRAVLRTIGNDDPLASVPRDRLQSDDLVIARDGQTACARIDGSKRLVLFRPGAAPRDLASSGAHTFVWLPAESRVASAGR